MSTFITEHGAKILDALALEPPPEGVERLVGVYMPSFHLPLVIVVELAGAGRVRVLGPASREDHEERRFVEAVAEVTEARAAGLRAALDPVLTSALATAKTGLCLDGMPLFGVAARAGGELRFEAWSPSPSTPQHRYFAGLHALAREAIAASWVQRRLEQLHGYLGLGLPVADLGGAPRHLRIFGRLSSTDAGELQAFFAGVGPEEPVIVDMLEFEGMGTMLYPQFRRFDRAPRRVAWVARGRVAQTLVDAGVRRGHVFGAVEAARAHLTAP